MIAYQELVHCAWKTQHRAQTELGRCQVADLWSWVGYPAASVLICKMRTAAPEVYLIAFWRCRKFEIICTYSLSTVLGSMVLLLHHCSWLGITEALKFTLMFPLGLVKSDKCLVAWTCLRLLNVNISSYLTVIVIHYLFHCCRKISFSIHYFQLKILVIFLIDNFDSTSTRSYYNYLLVTGGFLFQL